MKMALQLGAFRMKPVFICVIGRDSVAADALSSADNTSSYYARVATISHRFMKLEPLRARPLLLLISFDRR